MGVFAFCTNVPQISQINIWAPPSISIMPFHSTGANTPGIDMLARILFSMRAYFLKPIHFIFQISKYPLPHAV